MKFDKLYCNGKENPIGIGTDIVFHWNYRGEGKRNEIQTAFQIVITDEAGATVVDTGKVLSDKMQYDCGKEQGIEAGKIYFWTIRAWNEEEEIVAVGQSFETAIDDLAKAQWISCGMETDINSPIFSKTFLCTKEVLKARAYVTGLGLIHCQINGNNCTDALLMPPNTKYPYYMYFETFDLTDKLTQGENVLTVQLGNGYNEEYSQWGYRYFTPKGLRASIILTYTDGSVERIDSDESWLWQESPITANGLYLGEEYDARRCNLSSHPAVHSPETAPEGKLLPAEMPKVRIRQIIEPVACWETSEGTIYDFGKVMQGISKIEVVAPEGCIVSLQHSELINPDGTIDLFSNRAARAKDIYTCNGSGTEYYCPKFTYHGFRYVLVHTSEPVQQFSIHALHISADVGLCSEFTSSEPIVNKIHSLCTNSMRSNFVSIPTDCPVRDERTPCRLDSLMYEDAAMYSFNMYAYYIKWLRDISTVPEEFLVGNMDSPGDVIMLAYRIYLFYGDLAPAKKLYPLMKKSMEKWMADSEDGVWTKGFGDWCLPNSNVWEDFYGCPYAVDTSLFFAFSGIMAEIADLLGERQDAKMFRDMGSKIQHSYIDRYWHENGVMGDGRQPEMLLPLFYGVLTGEKAEKTKTALVAKIEQDGFFDVGGFGIRTIIPVLADANALTLFMTTVRKNTYPGYGYLVAMGATTMWEQWAKKGSMHSHSHAMHSGICAALYHVLCGVVPTAPAFKRFSIAPKLPEEMSYVCCGIDTYSGRIEVNAERLGDCLNLFFVVPPNTQAVITIPEYEKYQDCVLYDGERIVEKKETITLGSGSYQFRLVPEKYVTFKAYDNWDC